MAIVQAAPFFILILALAKLYGVPAEKLLRSAGLSKE